MISFNFYPIMSNKFFVKQLFGLELSEVPTMRQFNKLVKEKACCTPFTITTLKQWLKSNPRAYLITDVKDNNLLALEILSEKLAQVQNRIIPQIYFPYNYDRTKRMGYKAIIWTLYRYTGPNEYVLKWVSTFQGPFAITMPANRAKTKLPVALSEKCIPTYVHTLNIQKNVDLYKKTYHITEIYTDFLPPSKPGSSI